MKQFIYFLSLLLACYSSPLTAQYQSFFGTERTSWNNHMELIGLGSAVIYTDSLVLSYDTLIDGIEYRRLDWYYGAPNDSLHYFSYIREDTTTGKLWHLHTPSSQEMLIVDMSLQVGDSFYYHPYDYPGSGVSPWVHVDSVFYFNSRKHIRLDASPFGLIYIPEKLLFLEGVGSNTGIDSEEWTGWGGAYLLCQKKNDTLSYINTYYQGVCNVHVTGIDPVANKTPQLLLYPNPAQDYINIKVSGILTANAVYSVSILNALGQVVYSEQVFPHQEILVRTGDLPEGVCYVLLYQRSNVIMSQKLFILK